VTGLLAASVPVIIMPEEEPVGVLELVLIVIVVVPLFTTGFPVHVTPVGWLLHPGVTVPV
jgi:hypothetical protein